MSYLTTTPDRTNNMLTGSAGNERNSISAQDSTEISPENNGKASGDQQRKKREVYRVQAEWLVSSLAWSNETDNSMTLALGSYIEDYSNQIAIAKLNKDDCHEELKILSSFEHPYPATKILWVPRPHTSNNTGRLPQLLATTADYLRLWRFENETDRPQQNTGGSGNLVSTETSSSHEMKLECLLNANKGTKNCAPLTSFDWNDVDPSSIITSSVDTTCAVWDIEVGQMVDSIHQRKDKIICNLRNQIVAHNHEVYDVAFTRSGSGRDVFVSVGGDGSVRLFDLRRLNTSTMLFEVDPRTTTKALVRVCSNKQDPNYVSAFAANSKNVIMMDIRQPGRAIATLGCHTADVNSMSWAPHSAHHICTASDDHQALIWELSKLPAPVDEPLLAYRANGKINVITWSGSHPDWIAIGFGDYVELLRV